MTRADTPHATTVAGSGAPHRSFLLRVVRVERVERIDHIARAPVQATRIRYVVQDLRTGERHTFDSAVQMHVWLDAQPTAGLR